MKERDENEPKLPRMTGYVGFVILLAVIGLWVGNLLIGLYYSGDETFIRDRGTFGDVFGAVNSLFTGMAFVGVVYSIAMQREELAIARREMAQTKTILSDQQASLKDQNLATKKQVFESTFFKMFDSFVVLTNSIDVEVPPASARSKEKTLKGKDAINYLFKVLRGRYDSEKKQLSPKEEGFKAAFDSAYEKFFCEYSHEISHYFRTLYTLLNFVESSDVENKVFYMKLIRAQLSDSEAALLLCNYLSDYTTKEFNLIQERYGLLKNVDFSHSIIKDIKHLIQPKAFGRTHPVT